MDVPPSAAREPCMPGQGRRLSRLTVLACAAVIAESGVAAAQVPAVDIYQYASECVAVRDSSTGRYVAREDSGYSLKPSIDGATPFRMQATGLGRYLLYGPDGRMPE